MNDKDFGSALKDCLAGSTFPAARQREVLRTIREEKPMKKKIVFACAMLLTLALAGAALAAALGVFGHFGDQELYTLSSERLKKLDQVAEILDTQVTLAAPQPQETAQAQTTREELIEHQYGRTFSLTLNQAYCDGNKLYYSYTLTTNTAETFRGEGKPTGIETWDMPSPGKRYSESWSHDRPELDEAIVQWLDAHDSSWYAYDTWGLGDGADLASGEYTMILDSGSEYVDDHTIRGYQEVELPENTPEGDSIVLVFQVMYGTALYYQDATGAYSTHIAQPENRGIIDVPMTVSRTGSTRAISAEGTFDQYSVQVELRVSDVDISGTATLNGPKEWTDAESGFDGQADCITSYLLVSGDKTLRNLDGGLREVEPGVLEIGLRYDLPVSTEGLRLRPVYSRTEERVEEELKLN